MVHAITNLWGGGGGSWKQLSTFDAESKFALKKKKSFQAKMGTDLFWTLSTKWFAYTKYRRTTKSSFTKSIMSIMSTRPTAGHTR